MVKVGDGRGCGRKIFAKIEKSNVSVARFFFKLSMDPLVGNDCPISIFIGLVGHGLSFSGFGQQLLTYCRPMSFSMLFCPIITE